MASGACGLPSAIWIRRANRCPTALIAARIANHMERVLRELGDTNMPTSSRDSTGRPKKTPSWTAITSTRRAVSSSLTSASAPWEPTASRSRPSSFKDGKIIGTKRLFADGKFGTKDGKATFMEAQWRGLQAPGKEEQKKKFKYLINNGRTNHVWQNAYLDQDNEFIMDRWPYPFIEINPDDMRELNVTAGDLVEVYNDDGSTQAMVYPTPTAKKDTPSCCLPTRPAFRATWSTLAPTS